jgi:hypothetical protein
MTLRPTKNEIPAAVTVLISIDRRRAGGRAENLKNAALDLLRMLRQEKRLGNPPGIFATVAGARAR